MPVLSAALGGLRSRDVLGLKPCIQISAPIDERAVAQACCANGARATRTSDLGLWETHVGGSLSKG